MSSVPVSAAPIPALALRQHKAALWADSRLSVYATVMGSRVPNLPTMLAGADAVDFDCLLPGALSVDVQRGAPYLVHLKLESVFTDWLLFEAAAGIGDWGVVARCDRPMTAVRGHMRSLLNALTPAGQAIRLEWMDPVVLRALLPLFDPAGLVSFMGPLQALVIPGSVAWTTATLTLGRLDLRSVPVATAA